MKNYPSYKFDNQDPVIREIAKMTKGTSLAQIERKSGVTTSCMRNWFSGKTKRPQFATIAAVAKACGKTIRFEDK